MDFQAVRRQRYLTEQYYRLRLEVFQHWTPLYLEGLHAPRFILEDRSEFAWALADDTFEMLLLRYTAGEPVPTLRAGLDSVVAALEQSAYYERRWEDEPRFPPLRFEQPSDYGRVIQLIGLCYLLHRRDLLPRIAYLFDGWYASKDLLYEDLLSFELEDRYDVRQWYHASYRDVINALYRETKEECVADLESYLATWYDAMSDAGWHDSHRRMGRIGDGGEYFGYWAIEAGVAAYLQEVDDSGLRDNPYYPRDLVDYARKLDEEMPWAQY